MKKKNTIGMFFLLGLLISANLYSQVPDTPTIDYPRDGWTISSETFNLKWYSVGSNCTYIVWWAFDSGEQAWWEETANTYLQVGPLELGQTYKWAVRAKNQDGFSPFSEEEYFTITSIGPFQLLSPSDGATGVSIRPTLRWTEAEGAIYYKVILTEIIGDVQFFYFDEIYDTSFTVGPLQYDTEYFWAVQAWASPIDDRDSEGRSYQFITKEPGSGLNAGYTATPTSGRAPLTVQFTDQSSGTITSRSWDFGDGGSSTTTNPSHTYQNPGTYTVTLTVTGSGDSDTKTRTDYITVYEGTGNMILNGDFSDGTTHWDLVVTPPAEATGSVQNGEYKIAIDHGGLSTWDVHLQQSGLLLENGTTYHVSFEGYAESPRNINVFTAMIASPWTIYGYQPCSLGTTKQTYEFWFTMNEDTNNNARLAFDVGNSTVDVYLDNVVLEVQTDQPPVADFTGTPTSGAAPLAVQFTDRSSGNITSRQWDFGDGGTSSSTNPSHTYQSAGTYTVQLTVTGSGGSDTKTRTNYITVNAPAAIVADFTGTPTSGMAPLDVQFTNQSSGYITSRQWDFGGGETSRYDSPSHTYQSAGTYTVTLTVTGPSGSDTKTRSDYITVTSEPNSENLLLNGDFSNGGTHWNLWHSAPAVASGAVVNGEYAVTISNGGVNPWDVQMVQTDLMIENGKTYTVSFDAYADAGRQIIQYVGMRGSPWTVYSVYQTVELSTTKQTYTCAFTMDYPTDPEAQFVFSLGISDTDVYLDNVVLQEGSSPVGEDRDIATMPEGFILHQNTPNPFNPSTEIRYALPSRSHVILTVCNMQGRTIRRLEDEIKSPGDYAVTWDGCDDSGMMVSTGVYLIVLNTQERTRIRKALLVR